MKRTNNTENLKCGELIVNNVPCYASLSHHSFIVHPIKNNKNDSQCCIRSSSSSSTSECDDESMKTPILISPTTPSGPFMNKCAMYGHVNEEQVQEKQEEDSMIIDDEECVHTNDDNGDDDGCWMQFEMKNFHSFSHENDDDDCITQMKLSFLRPLTSLNEEEEVTMTLNIQLVMNDWEERQSWVRAMKKVVAWNHNKHRIEIPDEILIQILQWMNAPELLLVMSRVSTHLNDLCRLDLFWSHLYRYQWPQCLLNHNLTFFEDMLHVPCISWRELFYYRYTRERHAFQTNAAQQQQANENVPIEQLTKDDEMMDDDTSMTSREYEGRMLTDLKRYQLSIEDLRHMCFISDSIVLPALDVRQTTHLSQDTRELPIEFQFEKRLLALLAAITFEEMLQVHFQIHSYRNYGIAIRKLTLSPQQMKTSEGERYITKVVNYFIENCSFWLSKAKENYDNEIVSCTYEHWFNEMLDICFLKFESITSTLAEECQLELINRVQSFMDKFLNYERLTRTQILLLGSSTAKKAKFCPFPQKVELLKQSCQYFEQVLTAPTWHQSTLAGGNAAAVCGQGNALIEMLHSFIEQYKLGNQEHLSQEINSLYTEALRTYKQLKNFTAGLCLSYYNRACLHSIMYNLKCSPVDHEKEARRCLNKALLLPDANQHSVDEDKDFDEIRHLPWFRDLAQRWNENRWKTESGKQVTHSAPSLLGHLPAET